MLAKIRGSAFLRWAASIRLYVYLSVIITAALVLGTLIPQNEAGQKSGGSLVATVLQPGDVYHSWWFTALLGLLALNILCCSLERFSLRIGRIGAEMAHLGLVLTLLGGAITCGFGQRGAMTLRVGEESSRFGGSAAPQLDFAIRLNDFKLGIDYSTGFEQISDFASTVAVIEGGRTVLTKTIRVNDPLRYKGYSFFQSQYNPEDLQWTGLEVVRDPGVPLVNIGFCLIIIGVIISFYVRPYFESAEAE